MSTYPHGEELKRRVIELLRADPRLTDHGTGLLFPPWSPYVGANDLRIYEVSVRLPGDAAFIRTLPRVLIDTLQLSHTYEQDSDVLQGPVKLWTHTVVPDSESEYGALIDGYLATRLLSTWLSDARIIAARLAMDGARRPERIDEFNGAWQFVTGFSSANVGSLQ